MRVRAESPSRFKNNDTKNLNFCLTSTAVLLEHPSNKSRSSSGRILHSYPSPDESLAPIARHIARRRIRSASALTMEGFSNMVSTYADRFTTNISTSFTSLTIQQWIRLVAVVGAYLLARPYLIKLGAKRQLAQLEAEDAATEAERAAKISPNEFRGQKLVMPEESESEGEEEAAESSAADWGKKARRRQRKMVKNLLAAHEKKLAEEQEDEEDKDIQEFLVQ